MRMELVSGSRTFRLDEQQTKGFGYQVHTGVTGLGLPPVAVQWVEGAGDGATYRGSRTLSRVLDLPITILGRSKDELRLLASDLAKAFAGPVTLRMVNEDEEIWFTEVYRVGGGDYSYGVDADGEREAKIVVSVQAGDPFWIADEAHQAVFGLGEQRGLLPELSKLQVRASQTIGRVDIESPGDAPAYPTWLLKGPGRNFKAISPTGEVLHWEGALLAGETLTINTQTGLVRDGTGDNRYGELAAAPRMWTIPPGLNPIQISFDETSADSYIVCSWRPRKWLVI